MSATEFFRAVKVASWQSRPLSEAAKKRKHRQTLDQAAESVLLGRSAIMAGWILGGIGVSGFACSAAGWMYILSHPTPPQIFDHDHATGIVGRAVPFADAPDLIFSEATDHQYLKRYIMACEQWDPVFDAQNDRICMLMSSPEQQMRHAEWRHKPSSPPKALGPNGAGFADNFRYLPVGVDQKTKTRRYRVLYDYTAWRGGIKDSYKTYTAQIDFQYHPHSLTRSDDQDDNLAGFWSVVYSSTPDTPDEAKR